MSRDWIMFEFPPEKDFSPLGDGDGSLKLYTMGACILQKAGLASSVMVSKKAY